MARVVFKAAGSLAETVASATLGIVAPATDPGDTMIALYHAADNLVVTLPSGWELAAPQQNNTVNQTVLVAFKKAGTADSGATFNFVKSSNNGLLSCGAIVTFANARAIPIEKLAYTVAAAAANNCVCPTITSTAFGRVCMVMFYGLGATTPVSPTGTNVDGGTWSLRLDAEAAGGTTATISLFQGSLTIPGATGVGTIDSGSTVDAINVGATFMVSSDDETSISAGANPYGNKIPANREVQGHFRRSPRFVAGEM